MAQMSHPIKHDSLPCVPLCAHIRFAQNSFFVLRTKSSASMALIKKTKKKNNQQQQQNKTPPLKKIKTTTTTKNKKKTKKNSNKQITKTDKTQQTNVALATARAYKIYVSNVSVFLFFLFIVSSIVSSIWGKMVLKPYLGCRGFALIRLFFGGGFACSFLWHMCSMVVLRKLKNTECSLGYYFLTYKMGYTCVGYVT